MSKITKAIFPVAGLGTRFLPATKSIPKEIMTLVDKPLIQYAIDEAKEAGIEDFIFVTARGKFSLEDYFDKSAELESTLASKGKIDLLKILQDTNMPSGAIATIRQADARGLGDAVYCAKRLIAPDEAVAVILTDDIIRGDRSCVAQMVEAYQKLGGGNMVAAMEVERSQISNYGAIEPESVDGALIKVKGLVEKPKAEYAPSNFAVIGRYILGPEIFNYLESAEEGAGGEIQLTDAIDRAAREKSNVYGLLFEGERFDCGSKSGYLEATVRIALERADLRDRFASFLQGLKL